MMFTNGWVGRGVSDADHMLWQKVFRILFDLKRYFEDVKWSMGSRVDFNCHSICRALAHFVPELRVVDGSVFGFKRPDYDLEIMKALKVEKGVNEFLRADHSWLVTPDGAVIDPYPVHSYILSPILVVSKGVNAPFGKGIYLPDPRLTPIISTRKLRKRIKILIRAMELAAEMKRKKDGGT